VKIDWLIVFHLKFESKTGRKSDWLTSQIDRLVKSIFGKPTQLIIFFFQISEIDFSIKNQSSVEMGIVHEYYSN
jgi:hypothetical protein